MKGVYAKAAQRTAKPMNRLELAYAQHLEAKRLRGEIQRWDREPVKLRLADLTYYAPDFRVITADGTEEYHETKGFMRDDANVKLKVAAELHPYRFYLVRQLPAKAGGGFELTEY
jgi:hypothetical protein